MLLWAEQRSTPWDTGVHVHHWRPRWNRWGRIEWFECEACGRLVHWASAREDWDLSQSLKERRAAHGPH